MLSIINKYFWASGIIATSVSNAGINWPSPVLNQHIGCAYAVGLYVAPEQFVVEEHNAWHCSTVPPTETLGLPVCPEPQKTLPGMVTKDGVELSVFAFCCK